MAWEPDPPVLAVRDVRRGQMRLSVELPEEHPGSPVSREELLALSMD